MSGSLTSVAYIGATILFILSLGGLSNPESSRRGNLYGMIGMAIAVLATVLGPRVSVGGLGWIAVALVVGGTLGLLLEEEFQVKVLTLESGFDPDLFIRRKGKDAYAGALKHSQKYFDYLIERARAQFPVRSAEGKVKAVNYLLPHIQRVPSRIVRDELAREMAQKLGIDSSVLRQELKHAAANRSTASLKAPAEVQITDAEKILIRALASATEIQSSARVSARSGAEEDFDPSRQARFVLKTERLHSGLATESLVEALLNTPPELSDAMELPLPEAERSLLAAILLVGLRLCQNN